MTCDADSNPMATAAIMDGLAMVLAAMQQDVSAMAELTAQATFEQLRAMAIFCAVFAADQVHAREHTTPGLDTYRVLQDAALHLAAR